MPTHKIDKTSLENAGEHLYSEKVSQFLSSEMTRIVSLRGSSVQKIQMALHSKFIRLLKMNIKIDFCEGVFQLASVLHRKH